MKKFIWFVIFVVTVPRIAPEAAQVASSKPLAWAFPYTDKDQPPDHEGSELKHIPGSTKAYTQAQIDDLTNPPDWFPEEHGALPSVVKGGRGPSVLACASCHLMSGHGHPESADLVGFTTEYLMRQMADFKSGTRKDDPARMTVIAKIISDEDVREASQWFASLKSGNWVRVVEADTVPTTFINVGRMRLPLPGGGTEPLGNRIVTLPEDASRTNSRDPHSGFIAYVPIGSIAKGKALVTTGGSGKTIQCAICHGDSLKGLGDIPRIAGLHAIYIARQLYNFQTGARAGVSAVLMKKVVANLTEDDMIAIAAYTASQAP